ncbi:dihydrofolate reductase-like protein [Xylogone sp. PMI_703]|nr:dihydrofolate reductase-like protein [Xylogone sp. PMI_703]
MSSKVATSTSTGANAPLKQLKILMLHGFTQSGPLFHAKTRAMEKLLQKAFPANHPSNPLKSFPGGIKLIYPTAPNKLPPATLPGFQEGDISEDAWGWWRRDDHSERYNYLNDGIQRIAETILAEEGGVDGVLGFSQGGACAALVASLLDEGRKEVFDDCEKKGLMGYPSSFIKDGEVINHPLRFAVSYSGFRATDVFYSGFYEPKIKTPMMHVIGSLDTLVDENRSLALAKACEKERVVYHPGGHFVPTKKDMVSALISFIIETCADPKVEEESVEDMDVPF